MKPRPCGCKGCRTCLVCETEYGAENLNISQNLDKGKGYVYCPFCNKAWKGWDIESYKEHPHHIGDPVELPGVYIKLDFINEDEELIFMKQIDEMPWDISQSGRRKQNFGPKTNFKKKKIVTGNFDGFPKFSQFLQDRFESVDLLKGYEVIEQCSLEYDPSKGASIDPHIDDCWIWGERVVTVNCIADSVLTMTPYLGGINKYNLQSALDYAPVVNAHGKIDLNIKGISVLEKSKPQIEQDVIIRIPLIRRSLTILYGEARYHWEHCILREDIPSRRVCIAYREFTLPYMDGGEHEDIGREIRNTAKQFWDHHAKYILHCDKIC